MSSSTKEFTLKEEMKRNPEIQISDIQILREWCNKQPHLPRIQDMQLVVFLHANYYRIETAKRTIENYYTYRTHMPEFVFNRDLFKVKELRESSKVMQKKTKERYRIMVGGLLDHDPSCFVLNNLIKLAVVTFDESVWAQRLAQGYICIINASGLTMGHVKRMPLVSVKRYMSYIQDALPIRLLGILVINMSSIVELIYNIVKPFIQTEFTKMIHFHTSLDSAKKYFPIEALPNELGGQAGPVRELADAQIKIENLHEWYAEDGRINRVDESQRIGSNRNSSDLLGMDGSFKKLEID